MASSALLLPDFDRSPAPALDHALLHDAAILGLLQSARDHLGLEAAWIARYVEDDLREITHIASEIDLPLAAGSRQDRADSWCWHALHGRLPALIADLADDPLAARLAIAAALPAGCCLTVPLHLSDGTVWGSMTSMGCQADPSLNQRDLNIFTSFAQMAATRIESVLEEGIELAAARARVEAMLDGHAVTMFQQPIHALAGGRAVGVECLARFPDLTKRGPQAWFDDAQRTGLGMALELTAVRCGLEAVGQVPDGIYAAINASPATILSGDLRRELENCEARDLVIEIVGHQAVEDMAALIREVDRLRPFARIAIDDIGTGFHGLRHLADLQPDILKMDMLLTRDVDTDPARRAIAAAMVQFAGDIGAKLVAQGIETAAERQTMHDLGVDYGQGYLFARPLPVVAAQQHLMGVRMDDEE